jgi:hypothetical protein
MSTYVHTCIFVTTVNAIPNIHICTYTYSAVIYWSLTALSGHPVTNRVKVILSGKKWLLQEPKLPGSNPREGILVF